MWRRVESNDIDCDCEYTASYDDPSLTWSISAVSNRDADSTHAVSNSFANAGPDSFANAGSFSESCSNCK
jgi:hypothetical protein